MHKKVLINKMTLTDTNGHFLPFLGVVLSISQVAGRIMLREKPLAMHKALLGCSVGEEWGCSEVGSDDEEP